MADGPFRGERAVFEEQIDRDIREELARLRTLRREAKIDATVGLVGCLVAIAHAFAPWAVLFDILGVRWLPYAVSLAMLAWGTSCTVDAVRLSRAERELS